MIDLDILKKAIELTNKKEFEKAEALYLKLLEEEPNNHLLLSTIGLFYADVKDFTKAEGYLLKACQIKKTAGTLSALGFAQYEQHLYETAVKNLEQALELEESSEVYNKIVLACFKIKDYAKAIKYTGLMYEKYPNDSNSVANMVKSLTYTGKLREAEKVCIEYLKNNTDSSALWFHLGYLKELIYSDDKQACDCYKVAAELGDVEAYYNMAVSFQKQGDFANAEVYYKKFLEYMPNDKNGLSSLGMCYLTQKRFKEGYELYFQRPKTKLDNITQNPYKLNDVLEEDIVVICDQGYGDNIQFVRYLPFLKNKVKRVSVATPKKLQKIFKENYPEINFISYEDVNPKTQSIKIMDLKYLLGIDFDNIPYKSGYLKSEKMEINSAKVKVGLCWEAGSSGIRTMINRTINVDLFEPIFNLSNIQTYSFQVDDTFNGNEKYSQMINLAKDFNDFSDTAKALMAMDVVVTVDTAVAHLAGALGVKTFLMLPYSSDWRWFKDTKITPWYDSIEIFKQEHPVSWEKPIKDILCRLKEYSL